MAREVDVLMRDVGDKHAADWPDDARAGKLKRALAIMALAELTMRTEGDPKRLARALAMLAACWKADQGRAFRDVPIARLVALAAVAATRENDAAGNASGAAALLALSAHHEHTDASAARITEAACVAMHTNAVHTNAIVSAAIRTLRARLDGSGTVSPASCAVAVLAQHHARPLSLPIPADATDAFVLAACAAVAHHQGELGPMAAQAGVTGTTSVQWVPPLLVRLDHLAALALTGNQASARAFAHAASVCLKCKPPPVVAASTTHLFSIALTNHLLKHAPPARDDDSAVFFARLLSAHPAASVTPLTSLVVAKGAVASLWKVAAKTLGVAAHIPPAVATKLGAAVWDPPSLADIPAARANIAAHARLFLVARAVHHDLASRSDDDVFDDRAVLPIDELRALAAVANVIVFRASVVPAAARSMAGDTFDTLGALTAALAELHTRDERKRFVPEELWTSPARKWVEDVVRDPGHAAATVRTAATSGGGGSAIVGGLPRVLRVCPHVVPFATRVQMLQSWIKSEREEADEGPRGDEVALAVRRGNELGDAMEQLSSYRDGGLAWAMRKRWRVTFVDRNTGVPEAGIDQGGPSHELLTLLARGVLDPNYGLFQAATRTRRLFPRPAALALDGGGAMLKFAGAVVGRCVREGQLMEAAIAPGVLMPLVRSATGDAARLGIPDLADRDPTMHANLCQVLNYEGDVENDLCLTFVSHSDDYAADGGAGRVAAEVELVPGGADRMVTRENRRLYVHLMADFKTNVEPATANRAFLSGLSGVVSPAALSLFSPLELSRLISGDDRTAGGFDVEDLRANCVFDGGYNATSRTVCLLWKVLKSFSPEERGQFLQFVTGCPRPPLLGFRYMHPHRFKIVKVAAESGGVMAGLLARAGLKADVSRLPTASTCFNELKLPNYKTERQLRDKLTSALGASGDGFQLS